MTGAASDRPSARIEVETMKVDVQYRPFDGAIWLERGTVSYGAHWHGKGPVRKRAILRAMMKDTTRWGAPWLWD